MPDDPLIAIKTGALYFALIFALGFVLGTIRVLWLAPMAGETLAVLTELPIMLTASWFGARGMVRRHKLKVMRDRAVMGAVALLLLFIVELLMAVLLFGQTLQAWLTGVITMPGPIGLAGQILFGLMPLLVPKPRSPNLPA
jgi:hypothetical protein